MKQGNNKEKIKNHDIEFKNVSFSYDEKLILDNISCMIKEKSMTAIVGPSGSGKTTFCNLIARFWDVNNGEIKIGGKNVLVNQDGLYKKLVNAKATSENWGLTN